MDDNEDVSWLVVDNALDFLERAVSDMASDPPRNKYAAIHLFSAIEVLIKARLIREHWTLALEKPDGATPALFAGGDAVTVDPIKGIKRLQSVAGLAVSPQQVNNVDALKRLRNRALHFAFIEREEYAVRAALGRGLDFALWFLGTHVRQGAPRHEADAIESLMEEVASELGSIEGFVKERLGSLSSVLAEAPILLGCPRCSQSTLVLAEGEDPACVFCFWASPGEPGADEYVSSTLGLSSYVIGKEGGTWPVHSCPECGEQALVAGIEPAGRPSQMTAAESPHWFACFACGWGAAADALDSCSYCGELTSSDLSVCNDCLEYRMSRD